MDFKPWLRQMMPVAADGDPEIAADSASARPQEGCGCLAEDTGCLQLGTTGVCLAKPACPFCAAAVTRLYARSLKDILPRLSRLLLPAPAHISRMELLYAMQPADPEAMQAMQVQYRQRLHATVC